MCCRIPADRGRFGRRVYYSGIGMEPDGKSKGRVNILISPVGNDYETWQILEQPNDYETCLGWLKGIRT